MSPPEDTSKNLSRLQDHLSNVLYEPERIYKRVVVVTIRFKSDGESSEKCCAIIQKLLRKYINFSRSHVDIIVDSSKALKHPSGWDATTTIRDEFEDRVFHNILEEISDHDPKLMVCYVIGKGVLLTDPDDMQMIPKTPKNEFYAITSNESRLNNRPTFINYKYFFQDILVDPKSSQFPIRRHRRLMQTTDLVLLLDCFYHSQPAKTYQRSRSRTVEIITGWNQSHFINRFCKSFQHIMRVDHVVPEVGRIYETMIYGKPSIPKFQRPIGSAPIIFPAHDSKHLSQAPKYLNEDFDDYATCQIFVPMEVNFFGVANSRAVKAFANWIAILRALWDTRLSYIDRKKVYYEHESEIALADKNAGRKLHSAIILVPFRYETRFMDMDGFGGLTVKRITKEDRADIVNLFNIQNGSIEKDIHLREWIDTMETQLRKEIAANTTEMRAVHQLEQVDKVRLKNKP